MCLHELSFLMRMPSCGFQDLYVGIYLFYLKLKEKLLAYCLKRTVSQLFFFFLLAIGQPEISMED